MPPLEPHNPDDLALWRRHAGQAPQGDETARDHDLSQTDVLALAAYLDGRMSHEQVDRFEARLACEPALLDAMLAARQALAATPDQAPETIREAARALLATDAASSDAIPIERYRTPWTGTVRWAAAAVLMILVGGAGYLAGVNSQQAFAPAAAVAADETGDPLEIVPIDEGDEQSFDMLLAMDTASREGGRP